MPVAQFGRYGRRRLLLPSVNAVSRELLTMNTESIKRLTDAFAKLGRTLQTALDVWRPFAGACGELYRRAERDPALLRVFGKDWSKKVRRGFGRKIRCLDRARGC